MALMASTCSAGFLGDGSTGAAGYNYGIGNQQETLLVHQNAAGAGYGGPGLHGGFPVDYGHHLHAGHQEVNTIKVIHEDANHGHVVAPIAPVEHVKTLKVIHEQAGHVHGGYDASFAGFDHSHGLGHHEVKTIKVIHEAGGHLHGGFAGGVHHHGFPGIHDHSHHADHHDVKTLKVIHQEGGYSHGDFAGVHDHSHHAGHHEVKTLKVIHEDAGHSLGGFSAGLDHSHGGHHETKVIKVIHQAQAVPLPPVAHHHEVNTIKVFHQVDVPQNTYLPPVAAPASWK